MIPILPDRRLTGAEAQGIASWIAFAPIIFQAARTMRDLGILKLLLEERSGLTAAQVGERCDISSYGASVLLDMGASVGIVRRDGERFVPTRVARFLHVDEMTRVNLDFVQDVCYAGMSELPEAITTGRPAGLKALDTEHDTIYQALKSLPEHVRKSWFAFDHFYSDASFGITAKHVLSHGPGRVMDIGGNTGRFTRCCLATSEDVSITIVDLPGQLEDARRSLDEAGLLHRVNLHEHDLLSEGQGLPTDADAVWMSQFLDCFSEDEIVHILSKVRAAVKPGGQVWILEPLWDRQRYEAAEMSLHAVSLYFTAMANGNSRFYDLGTMRRLIDAAGLQIEEIIDDLGTGHTLIRMSVAG